MSDYYKIREVREKQDFETAYWGNKIVDPDGKERNRSLEREMYLDDIKSELHYINSLKCGKILDVGCGLGFLLSGVNNNFDKYGVEVSALACETAKNYCKIFNGLLEDAHFENEQFDVVVLYHVIEHVESPENLITEIKRVLKKGGTLIIGTPNFDCFVAKKFKDNFRLLNDKTHIRLFSDKSMKKFLIDYGFTVKKVHFPFFRTRHFTLRNLIRIFDTTKISPPFYGNVMTFYCEK